MDSDRINRYISQYSSSIQYSGITMLSGGCSSTRRILTIQWLFCEYCKYKLHLSLIINYTFILVEHRHSFVSSKSKLIARVCPPTHILKKGEIFAWIYDHYPVIRSRNDKFHFANSFNYNFNSPFES